MALAADVKKEAINKYRVHKHDTGSPEVQVALLSQRILELTEHLKTHKKDHSSRRGLLTLVSRRRRLVKYLLACDPERHKKLLGSLGLRR